MSERPIEPMSRENASLNPEQESERIVLTAGARLLEARQARQLNLRDVADKTHQSQETLEALETMETAHMPASIVRLQAKNYARFLGLPEEEIAAGYAASTGPAFANTTPIAPGQPAVSNMAMLLGAGAVILAAAMIGGAIIMLILPEG